MAFDISSVVVQLSWINWIKTLANVGVLMAGIVFYSIFVFSLYSFIGKRDILKLNLKQYNTAKHPGLKRIGAFGLYVLEYIIILPFVVFIWFAGFSFLLALLTQSINLETIIIITIALIGAIRITAYYNEELSQDLAKLVPITLLGIMLIDITEFAGFSLSMIFNQLPTLLPNIIYYFFGIVCLELLLSLTNIITFMFSGNKEQLPINPEKIKISKKLN